METHRNKCCRLGFSAMHWRRVIQMTGSECDPLVLAKRSAMLSRGLPMMALVLALILASISYGYSSAVPGSSGNPETVSDVLPKVDRPSQSEICPRCGEEKADSIKCKNCGLRLRLTPGRLSPYGLDSRARSDLNSIGRSNQKIDSSMRSLQKSLRDMNTSINRARIPNRRY
jgi:hypothetical protein